MRTVKPPATPFLKAPALNHPPPPQQRQGSSAVEGDSDLLRQARAAGIKEADLQILRNLTAQPSRLAKTDVRGSGRKQTEQVDEAEAEQIEAAALDPQMPLLNRMTAVLENLTTDRKQP